MKKLIQSIAVCILLAVILPMMHNNFALAVNETRYELEIEEDTTRSMYKHIFRGTSFHFLTTVQNGTSTEESVYIHIPEDFLINAVTGTIQEEESEYAGFKKYAASALGEYMIEIVVPQGNDRIEYAIFKFSIMQEGQKKETIYKDSAELQERYNEKRQLYEQYFSETCKFYTNIKNNSVTDQYIYIKYYENVIIQAYKDEQPISYISEIALQEEGSYRFEITARDLNQKNELVEYAATFYCTIEREEEILPAPNAGSSEEAAQAQLESKDLQSLMNDILGETATASDSQPEIVQIQEQQSSINDLLMQGLSKISNNSELTIPDIDKLIDQLTRAEGLESVSKDAEFVPIGRGLEYSRANKNYVYRFSETDYFTISVPDGAVINDDVTIGKTSETIQFTLYKDDEPYSFTEDEPITEHGNYRLEASYNSDQKAVISFYLIKHAVKRFPIYNAPEGFAISSFGKQKSVSRSWMSYYKIISDGEYVFYLTNKMDEAIVYSATITVDTQAPSFSVSNMDEKGIVSLPASLQFHSKDLASIQVLKNGEAIQLANNSQIRESGKYEITLYDIAGNSTTKIFTAKQKMQSGTKTLLIVVGLLVLGAGGAYVVITRNTHIN